MRGVISFVLSEEDGFDQLGAFVQECVGYIAPYDQGEPPREAKPQAALWRRGRRDVIITQAVPVDTGTPGPQAGVGVPPTAMCAAWPPARICSGGDPESRLGHF